MSVRNEELYRYIEKEYIRSKKPISIEQIANDFGMTVGAIKNFMFRHKLNKKNFYMDRDQRIKTLYENGVKPKEIASVYNVTTQTVYTILNK